MKKLVTKTIKLSSILQGVFRDQSTLRSLKKIPVADFKEQLNIIFDDIIAQDSSAKINLFKGWNDTMLYLSASIQVRETDEAYAQRLKREATVIKQREAREQEEIRQNERLGLQYLDSAKAVLEKLGYQIATVKKEELNVKKTTRKIKV